MKKALLLLAIVLGLTAIVLAGVDFSGTWAPNAEKSDPARGGGGGGGGGRGGGAPTDLVIKQTGNEMVITPDHGRESHGNKVHHGRRRTHQYQPDGRYQVQGGFERQYRVNYGNPDYPERRYAPEGIVHSV